MNDIRHDGAHLQRALYVAAVEAIYHLNAGACVWSDDRDGNALPDCCDDSCVAQAVEGAWFSVGIRLEPRHLQYCGELMREIV